MLGYLPMFFLMFGYFCMIFQRFVVFVRECRRRFFQVQSTEESTIPLQSAEVMTTLASLPDLASASLAEDSKCAKSEDEVASETENLGNVERGDCVIREREMAFHHAVLQTKLNEETQLSKHFCSLVADLEEKLGDRDRKMEILKLEKRECESTCLGLREELDITAKHLETIELSFNDVHEKYERAKQTIQILHQNVEILKESLAERDACIERKQEQFSQLKEHAMERMDFANIQLDLIERKYSLESSKLRAAVKEAELCVQSLSEQLDQGKRENEELTNICDGLIERLDLRNNSPGSTNLPMDSDAGAILTRTSRVSTNF